MYWPYIIMITRNYPHKKKSSIKKTNLSRNLDQVEVVQVPLKKLNIDVHQVKYIIIKQKDVFKKLVSRVKK